MSIVHRCCAALDVHKQSVTVCVRTGISRREQTLETAKFGTFTEDLEQLAEWLKQRKVRHVAMESTGVYWKPVWNVLELTRRHFRLLLVNPAQVKALPGKKTDRRDAKRICGYLRQGLLRGSLVPGRQQREWRELTRRRTHLQGDRNRVINRIRRLLETVNVKLGSVISNVVGKTGLAILRDLAGRAHGSGTPGQQHVRALKVHARPDDGILARALHRSFPLGVEAFARAAGFFGPAGGRV